MKHRPSRLKCTLTLKKMWLWWGSCHLAKKAGRTPDIERDCSVEVIICRDFGLKRLNRCHSQEVNEANRHAFITPGSWSPNSHDFNSVNYIWDIIQQTVYQTRVQDMNGLRQRVIDVWAEVEQNVIMPPPHRTEALVMMRL